MNAAVHDVPPTNHQVSTSGPIRVVVVDDDDLVMGWIIESLVPQPDISLVGETRSIERAAPLIARLSPDVVVLDYHLPGGPTMDFCRELADTMPATRCILHVGLPRANDAELGAQAGAAAVVEKTRSGAELVDAIRKTAALV